MKKSAVILLGAICALMILALPVLVPNGKVLPDALNNYLETDEGVEEFDFGALLFPRASAEEESVASLPVDFTPGMLPNPANFTEDGYADDSITVRMEIREQDGVVYRIAFIDIEHPSQLRTATAGSLQSDRVALTSSMAKKNNAIIAINGDYYSNYPSKTTFEYRQGQLIRKNRNRTKDILIIDDLGDFHLFIQSDKSELEAFAKGERTIVNAFTFGPALVKDGELLKIDKNYGYNPNGEEPRMGIGQMDTLSYVCVLAEGRIKASRGITQQEFANFMFDLGCIQAFNLDGGNSATMIFNGDYYQTKSADNERSLSDIIYFASAIDPASWQ